VSLALRAVVAIVLLIGFYVLAIAIAVGLTAIPIIEVMAIDHLELAFICGISALGILWSILPRFDRSPARAA
jgi:hypothetical protein